MYKKKVMFWIRTDRDLRKTSPGRTRRTIKHNKRLQYIMIRIYIS